MPGSSFDSVFIKSGAVLQAGTSITVNAGNDISLDGASGIVSAPQLIAATSITLRGGYLSAIQSFDGNSVTLDLLNDFQGQTLSIATGGGNDDIEFSPSAMAISGATNINSGAGNDTIHLYNLPDMTSLSTIMTNAGQIPDVINLDGQDGADTYVVDATANADYVINVNDSGALGSGLNTLIVNGATTVSGQTFLMRDTFVAILDSNGLPTYQRINYNETITNRLEINGGDVTGPVQAGGSPTTNGNGFYIDGNSALMTINAGDGNDFFQVGQIYNPTGVGSAMGDVGAGLGDGLSTTLTTLGDLSFGVEKATVIYGGAGTDTFEVYSNKADLSMIGGSGDDTFIVRAFLVAAGTHLNVKGGTGNDTIEYNINAPLDIEGGTGFNTLVLLGTEANDTFVVTKDGVYGGGLNVSYTNIQAVTIDTLEGNDTVYVESTPQNVVTTINGGAGGDTFVVGGDVTNAVISASTKGASSVTDNSVTSNDGSYEGIFVPGLSVTVAGSGGAIISQPPQSVVHVNDPSSISSFTVSQPTGLLAGNVAYVNISPTLPSAEWAAQGAAGLQVSIDGGTTWTSSAQLKFVGGVTGTQTVMVRANAVPVNDTYSRDESIIVASSVVSADQPALDALVLPTVKVIVKSSVSGLIIDQSLAATTIAAGPTSANQTSYTYNLSLNKQPLPGQTVTVNLTDATAGTDGIVLSHNGVAVHSVTFNSTNWNTPQTITVTSALGGVHPEESVSIGQMINGVDQGDVAVKIAGTDTPGVLLLTPQGDAEVSLSGQTYSYQMVLTKAPTASVTVNIQGDGQTIASSTAGGFNAAAQTYTFSTSNWNVPVTITLSANPNYVAPTSTSQGSNPSTSLKFPNGPHTLAAINGPLFIDGGTQPGQPNLVTAVTLPYETANIPVTEPTNVVGEGQGVPAIDVLQVYDDGATTGQTGLLSTISPGNLFAGQGDNISGLDLPGSNQTISFTNPTTHITSQFEGGINYTNLDAVEVFLGTGNDTFNVDTTAPTLNSDDGLATLTVIDGGGGSNTINVLASSDPLVLYGNESSSGVEYNSVPGLATLTGNAYSFSNFGADTINAAGATGTVVIVGGPGDDTLTGGSGTNWIFGGQGNDTIAASGSTNYIFGDSSATVGTLIAAPIEPSQNLNAQAIALYSRLLTIDNGGTTAGGDDITVTGSGSSVVVGDYGIMDIAGQSAGVIDPFSSLGGQVITTIASVNTALGGDDTINVGNNDVVIGGAGNNAIVVGSGGSDVIFGANGEADYTNGVLTSAESLDPVHAGSNKITGPKIGGVFTPGGSGDSVVVGGAGVNTINIGGAGNTIVGHDGKVTFTTTGVISTITSLDPSYGTADKINVGGGSNTIVGGSGSDTITLGGGGNVVVGKDGNASFIAGVLAYITTSDQTFGGDDTITVNGSGGNVILGGSGADAITVNGSGSNIVFGDNGDASFTAAGVLTRIETIGETAAAMGGASSMESATGGTIYGGDDTIKVGDGNNVIVGGLGADTITTGVGANIVLGDSGTATFDSSGRLASIYSTYGGAPFGGSTDTGTSGNDTITLGNGNNVVLGGAGADQIVVGATGTNVILGDDGEADYTNGVLTRIFSTDGALGYGGNDTISGPIVGGVPTFGGSGGNIVIGGIGADAIYLGGPSNTIIGDDGQANFTVSGALSTITTIDPSLGGNDVIGVSGGGNVVIGGFGNDQITLGGGGNTVLGDNGSAVFTAGSLSYITTSDQTLGGEDTITVNGTGGNVIFGGSDADAITVNGSGSNIVFGDNGDASFTAGVLTKIETIGETAAAMGGASSVELATGGTIYGGDDTIKVGDGNNVIVGGLGADTITAGNGNSIVLGDSGTAIFDPNSGNLVTIYSTYGGAPFGGSMDTGTSGNDAITVGNGNNVVLGGAGSDTIVIGAGSDVVLGDDGQINYTNGALTSVISIDGVLGYGGNNSISGPAVNGVMTPGGSGDSTIIGGIGADSILIGGNNNIIIGDDGSVTYAASGPAITATTTDAGYGGNDTIAATGNGNVIFGGAGSDVITLLTVAGAAPNGNVIVGDDGVANFTNAILTQIVTTNATIDGGTDVITAGDGNNIVIGGSGADQIALGNGSNIVFGDNAEIDFSSNGVLTTIKTINPGIGGADTIVLGTVNTSTSGQNIVMGGAANDSITINGNGANIAVGDNGEVDFTGGWLSAVYSTDYTVGGDDSITINGNGANVVIGGVGADTITIPGNGANFILGDNGYVNFSGGFVPQVYTIAPTAVGGGTVTTGSSADDTITVGNGNNTIFGGAGADTITAGNGANLILGDNGQAVFVNGIISTLESTDTSLGGDDTIKAGDGANIVFGGIGANKMTLGNGANAVVGGNGFAQVSGAGILQAVYSIAPTATWGGGTELGSSVNNVIVVGNGNDVVIGGTGADTITAGNGNDYIVGDNGEVQYVLVNGVNMVSRAQSTFQLFGGNDTIVAGNGTNSIIGGVGSDTITSGNGMDNLLIGDNGEIVQAFSSSGAAIMNADGTLHRDIVLEEIAQIIGSVILDDSSDAAATAASSLTTANLILLAGAFNADGTQVMLPANASRPVAAWETEALLLSLSVDGNDNITTGTGSNSVVIGQGGNNTITALGGSDYLFGNYASSTSPVASDFPWIVNADVIVASPGNAAIAAQLAAGGQIVVPAMNLQPSALTATDPQLVMPPPGFGNLSGLAGGGNLSIGGGQQLQIYASIVPSVLDGSPGLPGSNTINGGSGNDVIFGNFGQIQAQIGTGIQRIDNQLETLSSSMNGVIAEFSALSTAQYMLNAVNSGSLVTNVIATENNTINVGSGNNLVFGNFGAYIEENISFARSAAGSLTTDAVNFDTYMLDMEEVGADMSDVIQELGKNVIASYAASPAGIAAQHGPGPANNLPGVANLELGNNVITVTGNGNNIIIGDAGYVFMPGVNTTTAYWAAGQSNTLLNSVDQTLDQLEQNFNQALHVELQLDHAFQKFNGNAAQLLFEYRGGIQLTIGNDVIRGGGGSSILIGGSADMVNVVAGPGATSDQIQHVTDINQFTDALLDDDDQAVNQAANSFGVPPSLDHIKQTSLYDDGNFIFTSDHALETIDAVTISSGAGADLIYGGSLDLLPYQNKAIANFFGYDTSKNEGPDVSHQDNITGGVQNSEQFFKLLGNTTVIGGPALGNILGAGMIASPVVLPVQKATLSAQVPAVLETLPPAALSPTGAQYAYYFASLFPPLDPVAPIGFVQSTTSAFAAVTTIASTGAVAAIHATPSSTSPITSILGGSSRPVVSTNLASIETDETGLARFASADAEESALAAAAGAERDYSQDPSARFGADDSRQFAEANDVMRLFNESEIVVRSALPNAPLEENAQSWVFDEVAGAFVLHEAKRFTLTLDAPVKPAPDHGHVATAATQAEVIASASGLAWLGAVKKLGGAAAAKWFNV